MSTNSSALGTSTTPPSSARHAPWKARLVLRVLEQIEYGRLHVELPSGSRLVFGRTDRLAEPVEAEIVFHDWHAFERILRDGDIGFAEGCLDEQWHTPDLPRLLGLLAANRSALDGTMHGGIVYRTLHRLRHALRANTPRGSRRNISAHYDLGNAFYALWLDQGMTYSSALFGGGTATASLEAGQEAKYRRILDQLAPAPGTRILEVGCGWGGFAELAASEQCHVTGLTLSRRQLDYATDRLAAAGLAERAELRFRDYRDERGRYDAVVSIEMIEAVGERWWPEYFSRIHDALPYGGKAVIQSIVIADDLFERYRKGSDFIQSYIFPGGMLPCAARLRTLADAVGFHVADEFRFGPDYARTLGIWRERFLAQADAVRALGFDARFMRMWEFYFAYCSAGFTSGSTDVIQFTFVKR